MAVPLPVAPAGRRAWSQRPLVRALSYYWEVLLTARGRGLLLVTIALALVGVDTNRTQVFRLFALSAGLLFQASLFRLARRPRLQLECELPERATAGRLLPVHVRIAAPPGGKLPERLRVFLRGPRSGPAPVSVTPAEIFLAPSDTRAQARFELRFARRGRYELRGPGVARLDPLALVCGAPVQAPGRTLFVHPAFVPLDEFPVPVGRRYQPGGIPLSSSTGDAIEFVGTRDYRPGDPLKHLHFRSWARCGKPVVKEFQEEYFCRIALVLDTFLPGRPKAQDLRGFEASLSMGAAIADVFSRSEHIVDVLAAGPDLYEVSAGRGLAFLENILDVLACLEPCQDPAFRSVAPALYERLSTTSTVVAILLDWDQGRADFLRRVHSLGVAVKAVIVRSSPTSQPWQAAAGEMDVSCVDADGLLAAVGLG